MKRKNAQKQSINYEVFRENSMIIAVPTASMMNNKVESIADLSQEEHSQVHFHVVDMITYLACFSPKVTHYSVYPLAQKVFRGIQRQSQSH